ncbi:MULTISPECIES: fasciclin domain-containing protein [unclassified Acidovorax]|uniref:fasciclin domain-containing protein n=1 Tax=unclassified Acidovorax TaxID=2684926 RepID=UPI0028833E5B|nr:MULTISPECIES: fasciclin domain-containing protein [unclassified Acidovorax]
MFRRHALHSAIALAALLTLGACATKPTAPANLAEVAASTPSLSTFNKLAIEAGLADTLRGTSPHTVFAPSDAAFAAVPAKTLQALQADKAQLKEVLSFHIVAGAVASTDVKPGNVKTLQGGSVALARAGGFVTVEDALVEQADLRAPNGVVHIIDRVLMPPRAK